MKAVIFDRTKRDTPDEFFARLDTIDGEALGIEVKLSDEEKYIITVFENQDASLLILSPKESTPENNLAKWRVYGEVSPEDMLPWNGQNLRCILADITNEINGLETEKYFDWESCKPRELTNE